MEDTKENKKNPKWLIIFLLLFLLLALYFLYKSFFSKKVTPPETIQKSPATETKLADTDEIKPQKIIKCQSVVISPKSTIELFTYMSGDKIRADYRISATSEENSFKTQIFYDGGQVYVWNPPIYYGGPKPENPSGQKMKLSDFRFNVDISELGVLKRFGSAPLSGDHLCSDWDDVDPVFEVPFDFQFVDSADINSTITDELKRICQICEGAGSDDLKSTCRKNLVCD
ncbi:MAG: hypothetical protein WC841_05090 [Candidatus Shapirobacteria bacterium]|jgi:hypothetical protein